MRHLGILLMLPWLAACLAAAPAAGSAEDPDPGFIAGADVSHLALLERRGMAYRDHGAAADALAILKAHGVNCARLRLWTSSEEEAAADPYGHGNTLAYTIALAQRVKRAGLLLLLDLHYSDTWADPGHQALPRAWAGLDFDQLERRFYEYDRDVIAAFRDAGALPDLVQIGNETPNGFAWPAGKLDQPGQWARLARLIRAAGRGIAEAGGARRPKTIIHLDRGGDWATSRWFFDELVRTQQVDFDIIGQSYYPFWHGGLDQVRDCLAKCVERYGKPVLIAETAFPWVAARADGTPAEPIVGIAPGPEGQAAFVRELGGILAALPGHRGLGLCWWGAEYQPGTGFDTDGFDGRSCFGRDGEVLPVASALGALARAGAVVGPGPGERAR